jgi:phospholipid/cholesterol/gamma-HCH transport system permease protein
VTTGSLTASAQGDHLALALNGTWTADRAAELERLIDEATARYGHARQVDIDLGGLERLDTFGAWLIERLQRAFALQGSTAKVVNFSAADSSLMDEVRHLNRAPRHNGETRNQIAAALESVGRGTADIGGFLLRLAAMLGAVTTVILATFAKPSRLRLTSIIHHLERVGWRAVPIIVVSTFLIGAILTQQGIFRFRAFGAEAYVVDMVTAMINREVGVLIVCVMVAGRSGSAYTAELGAMKMREEIDALRTMGLDPIEVLVLPRIIALVIAVPLLTFLGAMAALYGAGIVCWVYGGMPPDVYIERLREAVWIPSFEVGMIKAPFMALMIGLVACTEGFDVEGSTASLGLKTTASVVKSTFMVFALDGLFTLFFAGIGM